MMFISFRMPIKTILGMSFALGEDGRERVVSLGKRLLREAAP